jgi:hypothetical protein
LHAIGLPEKSEFTDLPFKLQSEIKNFFSN